MDILEIAQTIANKIDTHSQKELEAMMEIICDVHGFKMRTLHANISNLYMKSESYKQEKVNVDLGMYWQTFGRKRRISGP